MILLFAEGNANTAVAAKAGVRKQTAGKWRKRFLDRRLDGLLDEPRPGGAPRKVTDAEVETVLTMTFKLSKDRCSSRRSATLWACT